jgi:hypothetical protein
VARAVSMAPDWRYPLLRSGSSKPLRPSWSISWRRHGTTDLRRAVREGHAKHTGIRGSTEKAEEENEEEPGLRETSSKKTNEEKTLSRRQFYVTFRSPMTVTGPTPGIFSSFRARSLWRCQFLLGIDLGNDADDCSLHDGRSRLEVVDSQLHFDTLVPSREGASIRWSDGGRIDPDSPHASMPK